MHDKLSDLLLKTAVNSVYTPLSIWGQMSSAHTVASFLTYLSNFILSWTPMPLKLFSPNKSYLLTYLLTYSLTPWCRVLLEKLTGLQLVKKFPTFHGTRRFITALTSVRHLPLSWASPIQSIYPHPTSWRSVLILSTHLRLGLPSGLFPSGVPTNTLYTPLSSPIRATHYVILT